MMRQIVDRGLRPAQGAVRIGLDLDRAERARESVVEHQPPRHRVADFENFLERLTGLIKYVLNHHDGKVTYSELAAATAQSLVTIRSGINYLVMRGYISIVQQESNTLWLGPGTTINDPGGAARLRTEIQNLLAETVAYHAYFLRTDKDNMLP